MLKSSRLECVYKIIEVQSRDELQNLPISTFTRLSLEHHPQTAATGLPEHLAITPMKHWVLQPSLNGTQQLCIRLEQGGGPRSCEPSIGDCHSTLDMVDQTMVDSSKR
jgi:hypothetical protein